MEKKLEVRDLKISFKTNNGSVKAVRNINFTLNKGETLAIVGESGSGKSVTSRAILGILAPNKIIEGGEIIYDGMDLLKITEGDFHNIRGSKISMIFQDPMSSLNPIMKVGKQLTEAMLLKGKSSQKEAKKSIFKYIQLLSEKTIPVLKDSSQIEKFNHLLKIFEQISLYSANLEKSYLNVKETLTNLIIDFTVLNENLNSFPLDKKSIKLNINLICRELKFCKNEFLIDQDFTSMCEELNRNFESFDQDNLMKIANNSIELFEKCFNLLKPDFFSISYLRLHDDKAELVEISNEEIMKLNDRSNLKLYQDFFTDFLLISEIGLKKTDEEILEFKRTTIDDLKSVVEYFSQTNIDKKTSFERANDLYGKVKSCINYFSLIKDNISYTFKSGFQNALMIYFSGLENNDKVQSDYDKALEKYQNYTDKQKINKGKPVPPIIINLKLAKKNIIDICERLILSYKNDIDEKVDEDYKKMTKDFLDHTINLVSQSVYTISKRMAKNKALELMREVGIPEPRKRYNQYPFQFSGGMRQRIVIAIALAANPDILICDEPTTALDVTIQSQILELINRLKVERELSIIFITHDLGVVANMADRIAVMYAGKIIEYGKVDEIFYEPKHPYTWALLSSMPDLNTKEKLESIPGTPPNMIYPPEGDAFAARNKYALKIDFEKEPPFFKISETHYAATWLLHSKAPKVEPPKIVTERIKTFKLLGGNGNAK